MAEKYRSRYPFDTPLTPAGVEQARSSGARLRELEPPQEVPLGTAITSSKIGFDTAEKEPSKVA